MLVFHKFLKIPAVVLAITALAATAQEVAVARQCHQEDAESAAGCDGAHSQAMLQATAINERVQVEVGSGEGTQQDAIEESVLDDSTGDHGTGAKAAGKGMHAAKKFWGRRRRAPPPPPPPPPPAPRPTPAPYYGPLCSDSPASWRSSSGSSCDDYRNRNYCTSSGGKGSGWWFFWGEFGSYAVNGIDATKACCACGGGKKKPQKLCSVTEKRGNHDYGLSMRFHTDTYLGCQAHQCTPQKFLSSGASKAFEATAGQKGSCSCWAMTDDGTSDPATPMRTFIFSHVPVGGCSAQKCWTAYAEILRIFKGGSPAANTAISQDPESPSHWSASCEARVLHLEDDHTIGMATAGQLVQTLMSWDSQRAVEEILRRVNMADELSADEATRLGSGHGAELPVDMRTVLGHIAGTWDSLAGSALSFLENLGISVLDLLTGSAETTILGTTFTTENYYALMGRFLIAGMTSVAKMNQWYYDLSGGGKVGNGPGPNTKTYYGWARCRDLLQALGAKLEAGQAVRKNELGMQIFNGVMWPDAPGGERTIFLGASLENHAFVRPLLADVLDNAKGGAECDGSTCWSHAWLRKKAREWLAARDSFESSDLKWFTTWILHKVHLNLELSEGEARAFADYMTAVILPTPFAESQVDNFIVKTALGIPKTLAKRAAYLTKFQSAIRAKFPGRRFSDPEAHLVASAFLDSLQFAGGLSVPSALAYVLALTHMPESSKWPALKGLKLDNSNIPSVLWEALRLYPPVAGFPWWEKEGGKWKHEIVNVVRALQDADAFPEPDTFKLRPLSEYQSKSIGWVDHATYVKGDPNAAHDSAEAIRAPHSHRCPGKDLSFNMMTAFLQEFAAAGVWDIHESEVTVNAYQPSVFTIKKRSSAQMCWVQPPSCVHSWTYGFKRYSGCAPDPSGPWCAHFSFHVPGQWSKCQQVVCNPTHQPAESLKDTERVAMSAMNSCKQGSADAKSKASCACAYANSATSSKTRIQRCSALTSVAQEIGNPFSCAIKKDSVGHKQCMVYAPWYRRAFYHAGRSWNSITRTVKNVLDTDSCYAGNAQCCSQSNLATVSAKCRDITTSALTDDWLGMPKGLQGYFWLQKQGDSSSIVSFGRTNDGCSLSPGTISSDGKYRIRVGGDRSWSFATTDGGSFGFVEAIDLIYEFRFNSATDPTFAQIIPEAANVFGVSVPPWLLSFDMRRQPNPKYPDSEVWQRVSSVVGIGVESSNYELVQVVGPDGKRLGAFDEWVQYCEDPAKSGSSSPGYIWLHQYTAEPFKADTLEQELLQCPSILGWLAPSVIDFAFMVNHKFGDFSINSQLDPPLDKDIFDDFAMVFTLAQVQGELSGFEGARETAAERMCPPTASRPLDKFRSMENLAPSEEIDTRGSCRSGTAFSKGVVDMCFFLLTAKMPVKDGMERNSKNTWQQALRGKGKMTKEGWVMHFFDGKKNKDGDDIYPTMVDGFTRMYFKPGSGWDDMLETHLTLDLLGTHLVAKVQSNAPSKGGETAALMVKLNGLAGFERKPGFARWGGDMYFSADGRPLMVEMTADDGSLKRVWADAPRKEWEYAKWTFRSTLFNAVTVVDHLWFTHFSVANLLATVARERLLPSHPLRCLLSVATFGTIEVNSLAGHVLLGPDQILHRGSPFKNWTHVHDTAEDVINTYEGYFGTLMDAGKHGSLHPRMKRAPFNEDGPDLFHAISKFVDAFFGVYSAEWCQAGSGKIAEQGLRDFARAMDAWLHNERPLRAAANLAWATDGAPGELTCGAIKKLLKVQLFTVSGFHQHVGKVADLVRNPELVGLSWAPGEAAARPRQAMLYSLVSAGTGFIGVKLNSDFRPFFNGIRKEREAKAVLQAFREDLVQLAATIDRRNQKRHTAYTRMHPDFAEVSLFQ